MTDDRASELSADPRAEFEPHQEVWNRVPGPIRIDAGLSIKSISQPALLLSDRIGLI